MKATPTMRQTMSFGRRLLIVTVAVTAIALALGTMFGLRTYERQRRDARQELLDEARAGARAADRFLTDRIELLRIVASSPAVVRGDREEMRLVLRTMLGERVLLDDIGWVGADGRNVVLPSRSLIETANVDLSGRDYVRAVVATAQPYVSDGLVTQIDPAPVVVLAVPTFDASGRLTGIVTGPVQLDVLRPPVEALRGHASLTILDRAGQLIVALEPITELRTIDSEVHERLRAQLGRVRSGVDALDRRSDHVVAAAPIEKSGWIVVAERSAASTYGPARVALATLMLSWSGFALVAVVGAWRLGGRVDRFAARREARARSMVAVQAGLIEASRFDEVVEAFGGHAARLLEARTAALVLDEGGESLRAFFAKNHPLAEATTLPRETPLGEAIALGGRSEVTSRQQLVDRFPGSAPLLSRLGLEAFAAVAIPIPQNSPSAVGVAFDAPRALSEDEWATLESLALSVGQAIVRSQAYEAEHHARQVAERAAAERDLVADVTARFSRAMTPDDVGDALAGAARGLGTAAAVYLLDEERRNLRLLGAVPMLAEQLRDQWTEVPLDPSRSTLADVIVRGEPSLLGSVQAIEEQWPQLRSLNDELHTQAWATYPLRSGSRVIGSVAYLYFEPQPFDDDQLRLLGIVNERLVEALVRALAQEAEHRATERADTLFRFTRALAAVSTVEEVGSVIAHSGAQAINARTSTVLVMSNDRSGLEMLAWHGYTDDEMAPWSAIPVAVPLPATDAVRDGKPVYIESLGEFGERYPGVLDSATRLGDHAMAALALLGARSEPLGVLFVAFREPHVFTTGERELMAAVAAQGSESLARARAEAAAADVERDARRRVEQLQALTAALAAVATFEQLAEEALPLAAQVLGGHDARLWLVDDRQASVAVVATTGPLAPDDVPPQPLSASVAGPCSIEILLSTSGVIDGILEVVYQQPTTLSADQRRAGDAVAAVLAQSVARLRLADHEHTVALRLQEAMFTLPSSTIGVEVASIYRPASKGLNIGGDWCDVIDRDDGSVGIVVGDVVGHSLDAAAAMGKIATMLRTLAMQIADPAAVIDRLDQLLRGDEQAAGTTLFYGVLDPGRTTLHYCCAGHPSPLVLARDCDPCFLEAARSAPLRSVRQGVRRIGTTALAPGTTLVLYTDGLIERRRESLDVGFARLADAAATRASFDAPALAAGLVEALVPGPVQPDDLAVLIVRTLVPVIDRPIPALAGEVPVLRRTLRDRLGELGLGDHDCERVLIGVGEAFANVVEHAYHDVVPGMAWLTIFHHGDQLDVLVRDHGTWDGRPSHPFGGRGTLLMARMADRCDVRTTSDGTTTTLRYRLAPREAPS